MSQKFPKSTSVVTSDWKSDFDFDFDFVFHLTSISISTSCLDFDFDFDFVFLFFLTSISISTSCLNFDFDFDFVFLFFLTSISISFFCFSWLRFRFIFSKFPSTNEKNLKMAVDIVPKLHLDNRFSGYPFYQRNSFRPQMKKEGNKWLSISFQNFT